MIHVFQPIFSWLTVSDKTGSFAELRVLYQCNIDSVLFYSFHGANGLGKRKELLNIYGLYMLCVFMLFFVVFCVCAVVCVL